MSKQLLKMTVTGDLSAKVIYLIDWRHYKWDLVLSNFHRDAVQFLRAIVYNVVFHSYNILLLWVETIYVRLDTSFVCRVYSAFVIED